MKSERGATKAVSLGKRRRGPKHVWRWVCDGQVDSSSVVTGREKEKMAVGLGAGRGRSFPWTTDVLSE